MDVSLNIWFRLYSKCPPAGTLWMGKVRFLYYAGAPNTLQGISICPSSIVTLRTYAYACTVAKSPTVTPILEAEADPRLKHLTDRVLILISNALKHGGMPRTHAFQRPRLQAWSRRLTVSEGASRESYDGDPRTCTCALMSDRARESPG